MNNFKMLSAAVLPPPFVAIGPCAKARSSPLHLPATNCTSLHPLEGGYIRGISHHYGRKLESLVKSVPNDLAGDARAIATIHRVTGPLVDSPLSLSHQHQWLDGKSVWRLLRGFRFFSDRAPPYLKSKNPET